MPFPVSGTGALAKAGLRRKIEAEGIVNPFQVIVLRASEDWSLRRSAFKGVMGFVSHWAPLEHDSGLPTGESPAHANGL